MAAWTSRHPPRHAVGWRFAVALAGTRDIRTSDCLLVIRPAGGLALRSLEHELGEPEQGDRLLLFSAPERHASSGADARALPAAAGP